MSEPTERVEQNDRKSSGINIGSASIIMVFSVLCLTVFAVLTFLTANSEYKLAVRSADSVKNYYAADTAACEKVAELQNAAKLGDGSFMALANAAEALGMKTNNTEDGLIFEFVQPIDEKQELSIMLNYTGSDVETIKWKVVSSGEWNGDQGQLWDGEL